MILVILESPYAAETAEEIEKNVRYARKCVRHSVVDRNEAPIASHLLFTQEGILRDEVPEERVRGMQAGLAWGRVAHLTAVYVDRGISRGMRAGITKAAKEGRPIEFRSLDPHDPDVLQRDMERDLKIGTQNLQRALELSLKRW